MIQVSVIIPVYNIASHLEECLDSVAKQTLADIEIVCVDDGSTDKSPEILARYAAGDSRFRVITQCNAGPGAARNAGLALAGGEFVVFLDSDDWFEADFLEDMVRRAREAGADITICRAAEFDARTGRERPSAWMLKEQYLPGDCFAPEQAAGRLFQFTYGWPWDKLYRMEFVRKYGLRYPELPNSEDLVFVFQSLALAESIAILKKKMVHHRVNRGNSVSNTHKLNPDAPYLAALRLQSDLKKRDVYQTYERSFLNWAVEFLIWSVTNLRDRRTQQQYFKKLKREWFPEIVSDFPTAICRDSHVVYAKYLIAKYAPYPLFSVILKAYNGYKGRKAAYSGGIYQLESE